MREHGDVERYRSGPDINDQPGQGCRCETCRAANTRVAAEYRARKAREQWGTVPPLRVDAEPVRVHVRSLMAGGVGWERVARLAGVPKATVRALLYGADRSRNPTARMATGTANKLLAVQTDGSVADGRFIDATGTHRRVQALIAVGWSSSEIMRRIGWDPANITNLLGRGVVRAATARKVQAVFTELWDQPPPDRTGFERWTADQARRKAAANGWAPPAAWDDDIDDPKAKPRGVRRSDAA